MTGLVELHNEEARLS